MDDLDKTLTDSSLNKIAYNIAVRAALNFGKGTLNIYYERTDQSPNTRFCIGVLFIARSRQNTNQITVLHPRLKVKYLWLLKWKKVWIDNAVSLLRERFNADYAQIPQALDTSGSDSDSDPLETPSHDCSLNVYDNLPTLSMFKPAKLDDEITRYLKADIENINVSDGLKWWAGQRQTYPCLSRMALDYLSIPGMCSTLIYLYMLTESTATSVDVERVFSRGRLILTHTQSLLSAQTSRAIICLGCWSTLDMVKASSLANLYKDFREAETGEVEELFEDGWDHVNKSTAV
jgi:hypothetical protein